MLDEHLNTVVQNVMLVPHRYEYARHKVASAQFIDPNGFRQKCHHVKL